jgi:hypothetical protein
MSDTYLGFAEELIKDIMADPRGPRVIGVLIRELTKEKQAGIRQGRVKALLAVAEWHDAEVTGFLAGVPDCDQPFTDSQCWCLTMAEGHKYSAAHCRAEAAKLASEGDG